MPQLNTTLPPLENSKLGNKRALKATVKRFSLIFGLFTLLCLILGTYWYHSYTKTLEEKLLAQEEVFVATTTHSLQKEMQVQLTVLQMTSKSKVISDYFKPGSNKDASNIIGLFSNLTRAFQYYGQVRLFDLSGNEHIRVNYHQGVATQVPQEQLQNKSSRYYFQEALALKPGESYISQMDLNVENGKVVTPHQPTLRFATKVLDNNGKAVAILVLNYLARDLLENFRHQTKLRINGQSMLIDKQGYWLSNHDRSNEWGLNLGQPDNDFKHRYPLAWPDISQNKSGILKTPNGLFRYQAIEPLDFSSIEGPAIKESEELKIPVSKHSIANTDWKLVIFLPNETIQKHSIFYKPIPRTTFTLLYLFSGLIIYLLISNSEQKKSRRKINKQISSEMKDLYENAPCGYHSLDANGVVTRINQTELNWLGYERHEVIGQSFSKFLTPVSQRTFTVFLDNLLKSEEIDGIILEVQTKQGRTFFVSTSAVSLFNEGQFAIARTSAFDITERIELEKRLEYIAHTDVLTGISNRRHFFERVTPIFKRHLATQEPLSLLMIDIDHFKQVNDGYGHDVGDMVLQQISLTIQQHIGDSDIFARLGGEEFVIVTTDNQEAALKLAENIRKVVSEQPIEISDNETLSVTLSIGAVAITPDISDVDDMLKRADIALYQAKTSGRNRVVAS